MNPYRLTTEQRHEPLGLGGARPRLSWKLASDRRGAHQTAYRITAAERREGDGDAPVAGRPGIRGVRSSPAGESLRLASGHYTISAAAPASLPPIT